jgi:hypothetical protein
MKQNRNNQIKAKLTRVPLRFFRTGRYLAELLVWSRIFVARRSAANIIIDERLRAEKGVRHAQPHLKVSGRTGAEHFEHGFRIIYDVLFANLRKADQLLSIRHALPGPGFAGVYLWDSAFIAQIWRHWDREVAFDVLKSVILLRDGDKLRHVAADFVRSPFTQPPLIGWSAMRLCVEEENIGEENTNAHIQLFFDALKAYHHWLNTERRLPGGLYYWIHPYESGVENAPRFGSRDEKCQTDTNCIAAPDLSAYMVLQCEALAGMAQRLGETTTAADFEAEAQRIRKQMNEQLWHEEDGLYYDRNEQTGTFIRSHTIASLIPLAAGVPDEQRAKRLRDVICDASAFGSPIPLPSVALNDPDFEKDMWRGPVWINTAYLVLEGLRRYGFIQEYATLTWRLCDGVFRVLQQEHQVYEFYDPQCYHTRELHRKKGNLWKAITLGTGGPQKDFVGWTGLVNTLVIEGLIGFNKNGSAITLQPCFPSEATGLTFRLELPQDDCSLEMTVLPNACMCGEISVKGRSGQFNLARGETLYVNALLNPCGHVR